jgi:DNA-binding GntR family transcriptional regulator
MTQENVVAPLRRNTLSAEVALYIKQQIIEHRLKPGDRLVEADFAERLQTSKSPIREAFRLLEAEGLVVSSPHRGVVVARLGPQDLWEINTLRALVEGFAAPLAAQKLDAEGWQALDTIVAEMADASDESVLSDLHVRFHETVSRYAGHQRIADLDRDLMLQTRALLAMTQHLVHQGRESVQQEHRILLEAMRSGDTEEMRRLSEKHIYDQMPAMMQLLAETTV